MMPNSSELDSVELKFYSETLEREVTVNCVYKFYAGRPAVISVFPDKSSPFEAADRDFHSVIEVATGEEICCELSDEDFDTINDKIDDIMSEGGQL